MEKIFYFDCETTGVLSYRNAIIQLGAIITYNDKIVDTLNLKFQPHTGASVHEAALRVNGITRDTLKTFMPAIEGYIAFKKFLDKHIDRFDKNDKLTISGFNVRFDLDFITEFFNRFNQDRYGLGCYFNWIIVDPLPVLHFLSCMGLIKLPNYKLQTCCNHFNIPLDNAHDALADVQATRQLVKCLQSKIQEGDIRI
jgi:DNA polymerase-3 subunit epsilon